MLTKKYFLLVNLTLINILVGSNIFETVLSSLPQNRPIKYHKARFLKHPEVDELSKPINQETFLLVNLTL